MALKRIAEAFQSKKSQLRKLTERFAKRKEDADPIDVDDLKRWAKLMDDTDGAHLQELMDPDRWADSIQSLKRALTILNDYTPKRLRTQEFGDVVDKLRQRILKEPGKTKGGIRLIRKHKKP